MTDDFSYPREWLDKAPPPNDHDPAKTAAIDARLQDLCLMHTSRDPRWVRTVLTLADDLIANDEVPELLSAVCRLVTEIATATVGYDVAVARFKSELARLRAAAIEEATS